MDPRNYQRSDERIKEDVCERLTREHAVDTSDVSVDVHDAIVVLEGIVPARPMKHAIENIASVCVGVRDVENRLQITRDTSSTFAQQGSPHRDAGRSIIGGLMSAYGKMFARSSSGAATLIRAMLMSLSEKAL